MAKNKRDTILPPVIPNMEDWPIYRLSEDRQAFVAEIDAYTKAKLEEQSVEAVRDLISKTIYLERTRVKEEPWKVDPPKEKQFWKRISKRHARKGLDRSTTDTRKSNAEILQTIIHRYSEEIVGTFRIKTFRFARRFLTFFFARLLNAAVLGTRGLFRGKQRLIDRLSVGGEIEMVRELMKKGTVVVVPTHFSNLDSILIGYAMDTFMGLPSFSYGAGLNLYNTGYTAYFMNRLGAYRVDRRKKNGIYLETLKAMSMLSVKRGVNSLFFPGGTRSRSGHLERKLKLGLLGTTVEAQRRILQEGRDHKVFIVPLVLGYHFVLEAEFLIEQHLRRTGREHYLGVKDAFYSPFRILKFVWKIFSQSNKIVLTFGQPMDVLGNPVNAAGVSLGKDSRELDIREYFMNAEGAINADTQREGMYTAQLGERIVERYHRDNTVLSSHLVAFAAFELIKHLHPKLDIYGILRLPAEDYVFPEAQLADVISQLRQRLLEMEAANEIQLSEEIHESVEAIIRHGIRHLGTFHLNNPLYFDRQKQIVSDSFKVLFYYHNRLDNYHLEKYIDWVAIGQEAELLEIELWNRDAR
jgi:glycerol-3-phosphate O-acyltransferase